MATTKQTENSVQFSLSELSLIEADRRQEELRKARERAQEQARVRAEAEAEARRLEVERAAREAAREAAQKAREETEVLLARERARLEAQREQEALAAPVVPQRRRGSAATVMGIAAMVLSVVGLGFTVHFALQPDGPAVHVFKRPVSIVATEKVYVPELEDIERKAPVEVASGKGTRSGAKGTAKGGDPKTGSKGGAETSKPENCAKSNDPLCGVTVVGP